MLEDLDLVSISAGERHSCGLRTDGGVVCLGWNEVGQADAPEERFRQVSAGWAHSCGVRTDGGAVCWSNNEHGQTEVP